jgi:hypothetical protein
VCTSENIFGRDCQSAGGIHRRVGVSCSGSKEQIDSSSDPVLHKAGDMLISQIFPHDYK